MRDADDTTKTQFDETSSPEELMEIIHVGPPDYSEQAVVVARDLLDKLGISTNERDAIIKKTIGMRTKRLNYFWRAVIALLGFLLIPGLLAPLLLERIRFRRPALYDDIWSSLRPGLILAGYGALSGLAEKIIRESGSIPTYATYGFGVLLGVIGIIVVTTTVHLFFALFED
jgi:hypothetical protein